MFDYVVKGGHLDKYDKYGYVEPDSYWNLNTYNLSQYPQPPELNYSNLGFSMAGELVRVLSGQSYENYVRTNLLEPLNLADEIYPDPGHRNAVDAPTQAGLRSYLINGGHPYNSIDCVIDSDCTYLVCGPNDPNPKDCITSVCGSNNTCVGCMADAKVCRPGWSCVADECINTITLRMQSEPAPVPPDGDDSPRWSSTRNRLGSIDAVLDIAD